MKSKEEVEIKDEKEFILEVVTEESHFSRVKRLIKTRMIPSKSSDINILEGKTMQVYWYLLEQGAASVREIHKALEFSSPGIAYYQIKKLISAGIVSKDEETDKYFVNEKVKTGILNFYISLGDILIPRLSIYLTVFLFGFVLFILFAFIWGDQFITNPGTLLLLFFLVFGTLVFIYESMNTWKLKPTKKRKNDLKRDE